MYKLSPSDFAYLYEECKLCYCLKVKSGIYQPSKPMPGIFGAINTRLQTGLLGQDLQTLSSQLPAGTVESQEGWVESRPVPGTQVFIKGKYDLLVKQADETYILVDFKISQPQEEKIAKYQTQLGAYKFALENPARGSAIKISRMGLIIVYPEDTAKFEREKAVVDFSVRWLEVPADMESFGNFMVEINELLNGPTPAEGVNCAWCKYRHLGEKLAHPATEDIPF